MSPLVLYLDTAQGIVVFLALLVCAVHFALSGVEAVRRWLTKSEGGRRSK